MLPPVWMSASYTCSSSGLLCWGWLEAIALTGAILTGLFALYLSVTGKTSIVKADGSGPAAFPHEGTVHVLVWLLAVLTVYVILFIKVLVPETISEDATFWLMIMDNKMIIEASVAFLAAGRRSNHCIQSDRADDTFFVIFSFIRSGNTPGATGGQRLR